MEPVIDEGVDVRAGDGVHRPARTAVTAARPAPGDAFFAAKRHAAAAAGSGFDVNVDFVNKHKIGDLVTW
jgi:hypothetical protein